MEELGDPNLEDTLAEFKQRVESLTLPIPYTVVDYIPIYL